VKRNDCGSGSDCRKCVNRQVCVPADD
jgi:hypothetical protein